MTDARIVRSRAGLRSALLDLLQEGPLERITIRDIAAKAGVGYNTYFRHYPGKEALLDDLAAAEIEALCDLTLPVYDRADTRDACLALCRFVEGHRALWSALLNGGVEQKVKEEMLRHASESMAARGQSSRLPGDLGPVLSVSAMVELLAWWLRQAENYSAEEIADIMNRAIIVPAKNA
ncbi:MAG TPA: helix-turn-helix domain-containing protein [Sphingobium sp.]|uniref:TetR/AcrR family transcriptional regulator n=1 Tax=Sphingobium sp. TaxID=1912891 RepID=UPI002ED3501B